MFATDGAPSYPASHRWQFETLVGNGCEDIDIVDDVASIKGSIAGLWDLSDTQRLIRSRSST